MEWQQSTWERPIRTDLAQQSPDLAPQTQNLCAKKVCDFTIYSKIWHVAQIPLPITNGASNLDATGAPHFRVVY